MDYTLILSFSLCVELLTAIFNEINYAHSHVLFTKQALSELHFPKHVFLINLIIKIQNQTTIHVLLTHWFGLMFQSVNLPETKRKLLTYLKNLSNYERLGSHPSNRVRAATKPQMFLKYHSLLPSITTLKSSS